jgi:flagellar basal body-associated protein FliL
MGGGIAILLALIIVVVGAGIAIAMYLTGGALTLRKSQKEVDSEHRPEHKEVTSPELEHTYFGRRDDG